MDFLGVDVFALINCGKFKNNMDVELWICFRIVWAFCDVLLLFVLVFVRNSINVKAVKLSR